MTERRDRIRRLYRRLLALYPADFRERYEADLLQVFDDRRREPRFAGTRGGIRLMLFLLRDFLNSVPLAHRPQDDDRVGTIMNDLLQDLRYALRMLVKNPVFTSAAVITLALGIGLNAATFSAVNGLLLRPLPGAKDPDRLVQLYRAWPGMEYGSNSIPHYQDLRDRTGEAFESVAAYNFAPMSVSADGRSERIMGMMVSANFFQTYGVTPVLGRAFIPGEESVGPGAHPVAILGNGFWEERFGGDPTVVGRTLVLNGHPFEVVGVAPADFKGPVTFASVPVYVPLMMQMQIDPGQNLIESRGNNMMNVEARLRDDVTLQRAQEVVDATLAHLREELPDSYDDQVGTTIVRQADAGIHPMFRSAQVGMSAVIMAVVLLLLLIACVNVANLFLARARERRREMGIRLSLGAGRFRVVRQLLTESLVFATLAGLAGLGLAHLAVGVLSNIRPPMDGPWHFGVEMDDRVLLFTLVVSLLTGILFGLAPALQAVKPEVMAAVKGESAGKAGRSRMSSGLVVVQIALSLLLLVSSGLFLRSLQGATEIDPGFAEPANLVTAAADPGLQGYDEARSRAFWDEVLQEVGALPEVRAVGPVRLAAPRDQRLGPRRRRFPGTSSRRESCRASCSRGSPRASSRHSASGWSKVAPSRAQDDASGAPVIIVNQRMAEHFWPGQSAIGKIVHTAGKDRQVIGVVANGKYRSLGEGPTDMMFLPERELSTSGLTIVARTAGDPQSALRRIQQIVRAHDPDLPVFDVRTMEDHMGIALLPARLGGSVLGLFGVLGLVLAAVGIYGVMAYSVAQRKRELGIRVALGADRSRVLRLVLVEGLRLAVIGTALGLVGAAGAARLVRGLLYNVSALDPIAFAGVPLLLLGVAALAVYIPARRAAGVEPMRVLKSD